MDGSDAVTARMLLWSSKRVVHECDGSEFLSPEEKKGRPCGCPPPLLEDRKLAARDGRGPTPSVAFTFRIAAAPTLGEFHFRTSSWQMAAQISDLMDALECVDGPAVCDLATELVVHTTKTGMSVGYRKPVVRVLGSPDTVGQEPSPTAAPTPAPAPSAPSALRHKSRQAPEPATPSVSEPTCPVSVDAALLRRCPSVGHQRPPGNRHRCPVRGGGGPGTSRRAGPAARACRTHCGHKRASTQRREFLAHLTGSDRLRLVICG